MPPTNGTRGILPDHMIAELAKSGGIRPALDFAPDQIQPASLDLRLGKVLRFFGTRTKVNLDVNNVFNANSVLTENPSFAVFRQPASILPARIARIGVQIDF